MHDDKINGTLYAIFENGKGLSENNAVLHHMQYFVELVNSKML